MPVRFRPLACLVAALAAALGAVGPASPAASAGESGPALETPAADLEAALDCPDTFDDADHEPVILVHGTFAEPEENWGWNYAAALPERGYDVCTVRLPDRSLGDIQLSSEYVVHAVREMASRSGEKVDVLGHSQGGLQPRWAVKWWPDVRAAVDDLVTLASPHHGTIPADLAWEFGCFDSCMQMSRNSNFVAALNRDDETPGEVSYTSVYSLTDELVQPAAPEATAALDGGVNVLVQELCPGRPAEHAQFAADAAVHAVVMDAFDHPGPFDPERFDPLACAGTWFDGVDGSAFPSLVFGGDGDDRFGGSGFERNEEPELEPYAREGAGDGEDPATASGGGGDGIAPGAGSEGGASVKASVAASQGVTPATGGLPAMAAALGLTAAAAAAAAMSRLRDAQTRGQGKG